MTTLEAPISYAHEKARQLARESRQWASLAGPVIRVQAMRCECGGWMRPGVDHECENRSVGWVHEVRHITGQPARCSCGWATTQPIPVTWVEVIARAHLNETATLRIDPRGDQRCSPSRKNARST